MASLASTLHHDLEWLEHELHHDLDHAKHFIGDLWGHLEHVRGGSTCGGGSTCSGGSGGVCGVRCARQRGSLLRLHSAARPDGMQPACRGAR